MASLLVWWVSYIYCHAGDMANRKAMWHEHRMELLGIYYMHCHQMQRCGALIGMIQAHCNISLVIKWQIMWFPLHPLATLWCQQWHSELISGKCVVYLSLRCGVFNKTSSHIWDSWYFSVFLSDGWIIDPCVHGLLDGPSEVVWFPTHNGKIIHIGMLTCDVDMVINGGRFPEMFLWVVPQWS